MHACIPHVAIDLLHIPIDMKFCKSVSTAVNDIPRHPERFTLHVHRVIFTVYTLGSCRLCVIYLTLRMRCTC